MSRLRHLACAVLVLGAVVLPAAEAAAVGTTPAHPATNAAAVYAERAGSNVLAIAAEVKAEDLLGSTAAVRDRAMAPRRAERSD